VIARVYGAINAVTSAFAQQGIAKDRFNTADEYAYRSIDDVLVRLSPLLAEHRLCVLPRMLERSVSERQGVAGELLLAVSVHVAYDLVSAEDGSAHTIEVWGEALDSSDKGTAKALQSAYKYALLQAFAVPVSGSEDADARSPRLKAPNLPRQPVQGWQQWCADISETIELCESSEAIDRIQRSYRSEFAALQRERAQLYTQVGQAMARRRAELSTPSRPSVKPTRAAGAQSEVAKPRRAAKAAHKEPEHA